MVSNPKIIIVTYPFTHKSAGVYSQHKLCHLLRVNGFDSYLLFIKGKPNLNPDWDTPIWSGCEKNVVSIAIYSELIRGNPIGATNIIYWILGNEIIPPRSNPKAMYFYWSQEHENHLALDVMRINPFTNNSIKNDEMILVYRGKNRSWKPPIWHGKNYIYVDRFGKNRKSSQEFSELLKKASGIILAEDSSVIEEAIFSGCPVIVRPNTKLPDYVREIKSIFLQRDTNDWPNTLDLLNTIPESTRYISHKNEHIEESFTDLTNAIKKIEISSVAKNPPRTALTTIQRASIIFIRIISSLKNHGIRGLLSLLLEAMYLRIFANLRGRV
jgi:hypothetical protein